MIPHRNLFVPMNSGHSQIHPRVNTPFLRKNTLFSTDREVEANRFAVELLTR